MAIPNINTAVYEATLPSSGKKVKFRPFNVREQKAILTAMQENDNTAILTAVKLISECSGIRVDNLPVFDVEYLLLKIRAKSAGEIIEMNGVCECGHKTPIVINLDDVRVQGTDKKLETLKLSDNSSIKLRYPSINDVLNTEDAKDESKIIGKCVEEIYIGEDVYSAKDQTEQDVLDFIDNLTTSQYKTLQDFFENMPKLKHDLKFICAKCGNDHTVPMEGIDSFFRGSDES
jgi:hypothetical protein